jgi:hypothetical protein
MANFPLIRGKKYSYSSIEVSIVRDGQKAEIFIDVGGIDYSHAIEDAYLYGTNQAPLGRTAGQYQPGEVKLTMGKASYDKLVNDIGDGFLGAILDIVVKYSEPDEGLVVDEIIGAKIMSSAHSFAPGPDALMVEVTLKPMLIKENGKTPLQNHLQ